MIRILISFGVLFVFVAVTEAASFKTRDSSYDYSYSKSTRSGNNSYKKHELVYEVEHHNDDYGYEQKYDHKPSYNSHKYKRSVYGYGEDSYGKSYNSYGGDSYGKSYSTYSSYKPSSYRHKRSVSYDTY